MFLSFSSPTADTYTAAARLDGEVLRHECRSDMLRRWTARAVRAVREEEAQSGCTTSEAMRRVKARASLPVR